MPSSKLAEVIAELRQVWLTADDLPRDAPSEDETLPGPLVDLPLVEEVPARSLKAQECITQAHFLHACSVQAWPAGDHAGLRELLDELKLVRPARVHTGQCTPGAPLNRWLTHEVNLLPTSSKSPCSLYSVQAHLQHALRGLTLLSCIIGIEDRQAREAHHQDKSSLVPQWLSHPLTH